MTQADVDAARPGEHRPGRRHALVRGYVNASRLSEGWTGIGVVLVVLVVALAIAKPEFRDDDNIWNVLRANAIPIVMACGMTFVILARGIDLSVGSMLALVSMLLGEAIIHDVPGWLAVIAAVLAGFGLGLVNGLLVGKVHINFFVVTLGTLIMFRGGAYLVTNALPIPLYDEPNAGVTRTLGDGNVGSVPVPAIIAAVVFVACYAILRWTVFGRAVYASGGNPTAARIAGIPVDQVQVAVYALSGLLAGLAAVMFTGRTGTADAQIGSGLELQVIAAVLLGGVSFAGGAGTIVGTLVGALLLAVINNGLDLYSVSTFWQLVVTGSILIFAVFLDRFRRAG